MRALFKLVNTHFWRSVTGPVFCFVLPIILLFFLGVILGYGFIFPGILSIPILTVGLIFVPQSIFEFKNSSLLKRISLTNINIKNILLVIFIYNFIVIIFSIITLVLLSFIIYHEFLNTIDPKFKFIDANNQVQGMSLIETFKAVDWPSFVYSLIMMISLTMIIGLFIASIASSSLFIIATGLSIVLITIFLAPSSLPIQMIAAIDEVKYFGYIWPLKYTMGTLIESFNGGLPNNESFNNIYNSSIWNINENYWVYNVFGYSPLMETPGDRIIEYFNKTDKILNLVMPYILIIIFLFLTLNKFSWDTRTKKKINLKIFINKFKRNEENKMFYLRGKIDSPFLLEAHNITKEYKTLKDIVVANKEISIKFKKSENVAILGGNGAGKTTFIEMLLGINNPSSGYFKYNYDYKKKFTQYLGVQFQDSSYPVGLKSKDIINFFKEVYNLNIEEKELNKMIDEFGIRKFYNKNANSLSGGQKQRLNLLLAILHKPKILFLDELSTGLDINIRNKIKSFIKKYAKENNILLVVISHDMNEVDYLCKRIIILKNGKIVVDKNKNKILKNNNNLEEFITQYLD